MSTAFPYPVAVSKLGSVVPMDKDKTRKKNEGEKNKNTLENLLEPSREESHWRKNNQQKKKRGRKKLFTKESSSFPVPQQREKIQSQST